MKPRWALHGLVAVTTLLLAGVIALRIRADRAPRLPVLGEVPDFTLTEAAGKPLRRADLQGRVWVASFIFTSCAGTCPIMSHQLGRLQSRLSPRDHVRLVSISVDPQRDTPAVLTAYAKRFGADRSRWWFATGDRTVIRRLARDGFHLAAEDAGPQDEEAVLHSSHLALVDRRGRIRGYYDGTVPAAVDRLLIDLRALEKEGA